VPQKHQGFGKVFFSVLTIDLFIVHGEGQTKVHEILRVFDLYVDFHPFAWFLPDILTVHTNTVLASVFRVYNVGNEQRLLV
jgi:hypothetical protein